MSAGVLPRPPAESRQLSRYNCHTSPGRKARKRSAGIPATAQRVGERDKRRIDRFVGELERAVMVSERELGAAIDERLHRLGRVHVLIAHEPARLVGADRQDGELERPVALARARGNAGRRRSRNRRRNRCARPAPRSRTTPTATCCGRTGCAPTSAASARASPRRRRRSSPARASRRLRPRWRDRDCA